MSTGNVGAVKIGRAVPTSSSDVTSGREMSFISEDHLCAVRQNPLID